MALKFRSVFSHLIATTLNSLILAKKFSIRCRHLHSSISICNGHIRCERLEMIILVPRAFITSIIQFEANQVPQSICYCEDFRRPTALRLSNRLTLSPPLAPCPWRWTGTIVTSIMAYSMSGSSDIASKIRSNTPATDQSRNRDQTLGGKFGSADTHRRTGCSDLFSRSTQNRKKPRLSTGLVGPQFQEGEVSVGGHNQLHTVVPGGMRSGHKSASWRGTPRSLTNNPSRLI